jgi:hypothetical protein
MSECRCQAAGGADPGVSDLGAPGPAFGTWEPMKPVRAESERLPHLRCLRDAMSAVGGVADVNLRSDTGFGGITLS